MRQTQNRVELRGVEQQRHSRGPERQVQLQGDRDSREQFAVRSGEDRAGSVVRRQRGEGASDPLGIVAAIRRQDQAPGGSGSGPNRLPKPLAVHRNKPDGPLDHGGGAAVVCLEVEAAQPRQLGRQREDSPDVRQPPAVDRLVVVADQENPICRCGQQQGQSELASVDVLYLVDQQLGTGGAPAGQEGSVRLKKSQRPRDEVVEIQPALVGQRPLVLNERARDRPRFGI